MVAISTVTYLTWVFGRIIFWEYIEPDMRRLLEVDGFGARIPEFDYAYIFWIAMSLASYAGIWLLRRWGRDLLVVTYLLTIVLAPFSGAMINAPLERVLMIVFLLVDGMIIGLTYLAWPSILKK